LVLNKVFSQAGAAHERFNETNIAARDKLRVLLAVAAGKEALPLCTSAFVKWAMGCSVLQ
jgi:hypothetical protein